MEDPKADIWLLDLSVVMCGRCGCLSFAVLCCTAVLYCCAVLHKLDFWFLVKLEKCCLLAC